MSLETKIETLTLAVQQLTQAIQNTHAHTSAPAAAQACVAVSTPVVAAPEVSHSNIMPAPPAFVDLAPPAPTTSGAPFTDTKGLIEYVMGVYKALGPQKGAQIQNVLTQLGYQNINDVKPEHYGALHTGIEALKVA